MKANLLNKAIAAQQQQPISTTHSEASKQARTPKQVAV